MDDIDDFRVRVTDIEKSFTELRGLIAMRDERTQDMHKKIDDIYLVVVGGGTQDKPGLLIRVDRMEQLQENVKYLWGGIFGLFINAAWEYLKHR